MGLTEKRVQELKKIWKRLTGKDLTDEEAWAMATRVLTALDSLARVSEKEELTDE